MSEQDKALLQEWLDALRSGKYTQAQECLHNTNGYCCLGVLCAVATKHGLCCFEDLNEFKEADEAICSDTAATACDEGEHESTSVVIGSVKKAIGFHTDEGHFDLTEAIMDRFPKLREIRKVNSISLKISLIQLNDTYDWTFLEIADLVEARPEGLFKD